MLILTINVGGTIKDEAISLGLARANTWGGDGRWTWFQDVIRVVIDLVRRLLYLLDLHVELVRKLLELPTCIRRHKRWVAIATPLSRVLMVCMKLGWWLLSCRSHCNRLRIFKLIISFY